MQTNRSLGTSAKVIVEPDNLTSDFLVESSSFQQKGTSPKNTIWKIAGVDDTNLLSEITREYVGNISPERWETSENIHGRILKISHESVVCDCLINPETKFFQKRIFKRILFESLKDFREGALVYILIREKKGSARIDVKSGRGIVDPKEFELNLDWDEFKDLM